MQSGSAGARQQLVRQRKEEEEMWRMHDGLEAAAVHLHCALHQHALGLRHFGANLGSNAFGSIPHPAFTGPLAGTAAAMTGGRGASGNLALPSSLRASQLFRYSLTMHIMCLLKCL